MTKKLIVFNWKMAPDSIEEASRILKVIEKFYSPKFFLKTWEGGNLIVICPPFIYLEPLSKILKAKDLKLKTKIQLGAQNIFWETKGAYTGEISPLMLKKIGVQYVIIGHSERRQYLQETDEIINKKIKVALENNLKVILCVGENSNIRKKGIKSVKNFIKSQLQKDLKNIENCKLKIENFIVAYEPIWAIGTGNYCNSENALEIIKFIKNFLKAKSSKLKVKILYGGSVNNKNINNYLKYKEIDGVLVGSASVNQKELNLILKNLNV